jgi:aerobic-type carbon monoxide dehydrogenase small subunit (CoxS/CutS family)
MYVNLWSVVGGTNRIIAEIRASGGEVQIEEKEPMAPRIRESVEWLRKKVPDDDAFLKAMTVEFNGSYFKAELIKD